MGLQASRRRPSCRSAGRCRAWGDPSRFNDAGSWNRSARSAPAATCSSYSPAAATEGQAVIRRPVVVQVQAGWSGLPDRPRLGHNSFTDTIQARVTQQSPANATAWDFGGGSDNGGTVFLDRSIGPLELAISRIPCQLPAQPEPASPFLPPRSSYSTPDGQASTLVGESQTLTMPWPATIAQTTLHWVAPFLLRHG